MPAFPIRARWRHVRLLAAGRLTTTTNVFVLMDILGGHARSTLMIVRGYSVRMEEFALIGSEVSTVTVQMPLDIQVKVLNFQTPNMVFFSSPEPKAHR